MQRVDSTLARTLSSPPTTCRRTEVVGFLNLVPWNAKGEFIEVLDAEFLRFRETVLVRIRCEIGDASRSHSVVVVGNATSDTVDGLEESNGPLLSADALELAGSACMGERR